MTSRPEGLQHVAFLALILAALAVAPPPATAQFPLLDGDVVVTLGDSNTAPGVYQQYLERFTLIRYPSRHIRYLNMGIGGETAANGLARLQRDVFDRGATVLFVTYGINDIGWGWYDDAAHRQAYLDAITAIVDQCVVHGVRVYVTTYPYTGWDFPSLHDLTTQGMGIATARGQDGIDIYATMKALDPQGNAQCMADANQCPSAFLSACRASCNTWAGADGVHLTDKGRRAWAYALVTALGASPTVSAVTVDAPSHSVVGATGASVTNVAWNATQRRLTFNRLDEGQPLTFASNTETYFANLAVPFHLLAGYTLKVTNLPTGTYRITVAGQQIQDVASSALGSTGVNLASTAPGNYNYGAQWMFANVILEGLAAARSNTNRLLRYVAPGSVVAGFLGTADALGDIVEHWVAAPANNQVVVEPAP